MSVRTGAAIGRSLTTRAVLGGPGAVVLLALLGGCSEAGPAAIYDCKAPACTPAVSAYAVEVSAPATSTLPSVEFNNVVFDLEGGYFVVGLPEAVTVRGRVTSGDTPVAGSVVFTRPSRIPGRPDMFYEASIDATTGTYVIAVPPSVGDERYTIRLRPSETTKYPPVSLSIPVTMDASSRDLDIPVPSGDELLVLRGNILDALGLALGDSRVVLRDSASQLDLSTTAHTDAQGGFQLAVALASTASSAGLVLSIERGSSTEGLLAISVELTPSDVKEQLVAQTMKLKLPALPSPTRLSFQLLGAAPNGSDKPVAGANVRLRANLIDSPLVGGFRARHEIEGQTGADGKLTVDLYSNTEGKREYTVAISPAASSDFQTTTTTITVGTTSGVSAPLRLPVRPLLTGRVLDPAGVPIKGVVVQPTFSTLEVSARSTSLATTPKPSTATTDSDGRFALRLDVGVYDLGLIPPALSQLPRRWIAAQQVTGDAELGDLSAPKPVTFDGVVQGIQAMPVRATVRLYTVPLSNAICEANAVECLAPPRLQAEGMTDDNGRAPLLLPADGT